MPRRRAEAPPPPAKKPRHPEGTHHHYKYTARAVQRPGVEGMTFRLQTPEASGLPTGRDGSGRYRAAVLGLSARPVTGGTTYYSVEASLAFRAGHQLMDSYVLQPFVPGNTFTQISDKFAGFKTKVAKQYPYFTTVPHIRQRIAEQGQLHYELILPPYTGYFTDDALFWEAMRFPTEFLEHGATADGRHGFVNKTPQLLIIPGTHFLDTEVPAFSYRALNQRQPPANARLRLQVEFFVDWLPQTISEEKKSDKETALTALWKLITAALLVLNLDPANVVQIEYKDGKVVLKSNKFGGASGQLVVASIRLSPSLLEFLVLEGDTLVFPSNDARVITLDHREPPDQNPLADRYPFHLVATGQSGAHHFVHGYGWVKVVGLLTGPTKFTGKNDWIELRTGQNELPMLLLDRWCQPVLSAVPTEFMIYLELVDPIF